MKALTVSQVGERLNISRQSVERLIDSGKLPSIRIPSPTADEGRCIRRVDPSALEAFIKENTVAA